MAGVGLTGLVVLFLVFDGITKVIRLAPVVEACQKVGVGPDLMVGIGILLLASHGNLCHAEDGDPWGDSADGLSRRRSVASHQCAERSFPDRPLR
jgi:hypothetical protein